MKSCPAPFPPATAAALVLLVLLTAGGSARAQQPFVSDDAEVTPKGRWHFEYLSEFAWLSRDAAPDLRQDTNNLVVQYGLAEKLEVNLDFPLIGIERQRGAALGSAFGLGDVDLAAKYKLVEENPGGIRPALTLVVAVELPTGNKTTQLGSGFTDVVFNTIVQKTLSDGTVVHLNLGYQFSGNTQTGAIGIPTPGRILTGGLSVTHDFSRTLLLGIDLNGAQMRTAGIFDRQLQVTLGGSYAFERGMTFDFALLAGHYDSPRLGIVLGMSYSP
jgi:Putative MetA-pathway of phenol degradation